MKSLLMILLVVVGCGKKAGGFEPDLELKEGMNWANDPRNVPGAEAALNLYTGSLPVTGPSNRLVWVGNWYPHSQGGTLRAIRKYDQAVGGRAVLWEQEEVNRRSSQSWSGHCDGLAAAGTMVNEPKHGTYYNGVWFDVEDVKALLIEAWSGGGTIVGGRCNNTQIHVDSAGRIIEDKCRDLNPATLHIVLANFLGRWGKPVILDAAPLNQVWNSPVIAYLFKNTQALSKSEANNWLRGVYNEDYPYNPQAVSMQYYKTEVTYASGKTAIFEYILELGADGAIIGGEWFRESKLQHPDFIWRHTSPRPVNPDLSVDKVYDIYRGSMIGN